MIIEHCFIKGSDVQFLDSEDDLKKLARADCAGIVEYYGLKKKSEISRIEVLEADKENITILKGEKVKIKTNAGVLLGQDIIEMESKNPKIATIDKSGIVTAINTGNTEINIKMKNTNKTKKIKIAVKELKQDQKIKIKNLKETNNVLTRIKEKTKIEEFIKNFELTDNLCLEIKDSKEYISTNTIVEIKDKSTKEVLKNYYCMVYGDINKDGKITSSDYVLIKNHIMETNSLPFQVIDGADVNRDRKSIFFRLCINKKSHNERNRIKNRIKYK